MKKLPKFHLAIVSCLAIALGAMEISIYIAETKLRENVLNAAKMENQKLKNLAVVLFDSSDWSMHSFLSSFTDIKIIEEENGIRVKHILRQETIDKLDSRSLEKKMKNYSDYYGIFHSVLFVFEPGVIPDARKGYAVSYSRDNGKFCNLSTYDILNGSLYSKTARTRTSFLSCGRTKETNELVWTCAIPLFNEADRLIGELMVDFNVNAPSELVEKQDIDDEVFNFILNDRGQILAGGDEKTNGRSLKEHLEELYPGNFPTEWYNEIMRQIKENDFRQFENRIKKSECLTNVNRLKDFNFYLVTVMSMDKLNATVSRFRKITLVILGLSLILLASCLMYIFRRFKRKEDENHKMEQELDIASMIQQNILPVNPSHNESGYRIYGFQKPAKSVGGDLYDFFEQDGKLHFCIGDVSGKGVPAALLMTEICSLYRYIAKKCDDARIIACDLNKAALEHGDSGMICTLFIGILNLENGHLQFCNAGHNPPVLIGKDGAGFMKIHPNMPIGAFEAYDFKAEEIVLEKGDSLFLYTDGITEARNNNLEFFGERNMLESIRESKDCDPEELAGNLLRKIDSFSSTADQYDDITLIEIKYS